MFSYKERKSLTPSSYCDCYKSTQKLSALQQIRDKDLSLLPSTHQREVSTSSKA